MVLTQIKKILNGTLLTVRGIYTYTKHVKDQYHNNTKLKI